MTSVANAIGDWLAVGLVHGTALVLVTAVLTATLLSRARPAVLHALWLIVLVKFLVPVGPGLEVSLSSAVDRAVDRAAAPTAATAAVDLAGTPSPEQGGHAVGDTVLLGALALYAAGLAVVLVRRIRRRRHLLREIDALPAPAREVTELVAALSRRIGLSRAPVVRVAPSAAGPYLVGRLRPILILPGWLEVGGAAWTSAVAHELAHLRRRDPLAGAIEAAVTAIFWFWPPVAWACRRLDHAREMACDRWALEHGPLAARDYAGLLVAVAMRRTGTAPAALGFLRRRAQLAARVDHLLGAPRGARLGGKRAGLVALWAAIALAGAAGRQSDGYAGALECDIDPGLIAQILATNPDADADRDGVLSQDEACAHQLRMKQRLVDHVVDAELVSRLDPRADLDADGVLSPDELDAFKDQIGVGFADEEVVLEYGRAPVPISDADLRVASAPAPATLCPSGRCSERPVDRIPLLIDVQPSSP